MPVHCPISIEINLQKELDGLTFIDKKGKVQNLSLLKNTIKLNDKRVFVDSIKLFHRLILVSDREITIQMSLRYGGSSKPV